MPKNWVGITLNFERIKKSNPPKVTNGMSEVSFFELKIPVKIIGAMIAVPVKLVRAKRTKCSVLTMLKIRANKPNTTIKKSTTVSVNEHMKERSKDLFSELFGDKK